MVVMVTGKSRAKEAAMSAIQSPLLDVGIERATGIVWNITGGSDMTLFEVCILIPWVWIMILFSNLSQSPFCSFAANYIIHFNQL
jgi:cell division GTPase FtsZ